jgi:DNA-binding response OmpR family regulator
MKKTILIADDDKELVYVLRYILKEEGYEVVGFSQQYLLIETMRIVQPDLILLDVKFGDVDGRELCRYIKESELDTNVILISGISELEDTIQFPGAPDDILPKPFNISELMAKIKHQLAA